MTLIQGGPPQWVWERSPHPLKWVLTSHEDPNGDTIYELRVNCGLEIIRLQFLTEDEIRELQSVIGEEIGTRTAVSQGG